MTGAEVLRKMEAIDTKYGKVEENKKNDLKRKRGLRTFGDYDDECAKPLDKKGKEFFLNTVEYEQARKWVLRQAAKNSEWEEKYNTYQENLNSRSQSQRGNRRTEKLIDYVSWLRQQLKNDEDSSFKKLVDGPSGLIPIQFDDGGQPIGPNRKFLCTFIGETTWENLSPLVGDWRNLEEEDKEFIRKAVTKSRLRTINYDAYETDEERKSKRPKGVKKKDWIEFVDRLSTPEEQEKREKGKAARNKMHYPHTTGQLGASGMEEILKKGRPKGSVKRYKIFMACHTEDGTYPEEMKERMSYSKSPMLMDKDLDNDAVAIKYGADGNGHARGYNGHLKKTNLRVSTPFRRVIERERVKQAMLNEVQESLEVEANERRQLEIRVAAFKYRESLRGAYMHRPFERNVPHLRDKDNNTPRVSAQIESSTCHYIDPSNIHAIIVVVAIVAVAAATAAIAKALVKVAHAAVVVLRLTGGSGRCMTTRVDWAVVRIQAVFRGYLAKKALLALKGLVKLQALVRGHIVRKKIADTMRVMQVLVRAQDQARARASSRSNMGTRRHSNKPSMSHPSPPTPKKYECTRCSNSTSHNQLSNLKRSAVTQSSYDNFNFGKAHLGRRGLHSSYNALSLDRNSQSLTSIDSPSRDSTTAQRSTSSASSSEVQSTVKPLRFYDDIDDEMFSAMEENPQFYLATSRPCSAKGRGSFTPTKSYSATSGPGSGKRGGTFTPTKSEYSQSFYSGYSNHPNCMTNTRSSRAKVRSQSAPRQRLDLEKSSSTKRYYSAQRLSNLCANFTNKAYPGSERLDRLGMPYQNEMAGFDGINRNRY
ncbi:hypothetical protein GIB67_033986 [Kingdonia uniflora]|uniref:DUF4005 domain-containing protein n=1 Tax=Kingdonia uniflora TaxID=39325 RepID=A0A7J7M5Y8_9MAGN|nr:hypothetical protein GIB67_033986 [Kingdonia uniflora]